MTSQERILLALNHKESDRIAIRDGVWGTTEERWHKEGLPEGVTVEEYFEFEMYGFGADVTLQLSHEIIEETDEYIIERNPTGNITKSWKRKSGTPQMVDYTIKDRRTWEEHKPRLAMNDKRINFEKDLPEYKDQREKGKFIFYGAHAGYQTAESMIGTERILTAMVEEPEWIKDVIISTVKIVIEVVEEMIHGGFKFDGAMVFDDLGYRNTLLFSPQMYREIVKPYHKILCDFCKSKGIKVILHSCGCVKELIPDFIEADFSCLNPIEVKAGMDLIELKRTYGEYLSFMGGIDARKMSNSGLEVIEEEIREKIGFVKKGGGYIYSSDHSVPDDVSFSQYKRVIELVYKYGSYSRQ